MALSALLGLWEAALELALRVDLALAKDVAARPDCAETQRQLWLSIGSPPPSPPPAARRPAASRSGFCFQPST